MKEKVKIIYSPKGIQTLTLLVLIPFLIFQVFINLQIIRVHNINIKEEVLSYFEKEDADATDILDESKMYTEFSINEEINEFYNNLPTTYETKIKQEIYECEDGSNQEAVGCKMDLYEKVKKVRQAKMVKLEKITPFEINIAESSDMDENKRKLAEWREIFDESTDKWCEAQEYTFYFGSSTAGYKAECQIDLELKAIRTLDQIHKSIRNNVSGSRGIRNF